MSAKDKWLRKKYMGARRVLLALMVMMTISFPRRVNMWKREKTMKHTCCNSLLWKRLNNTNSVTFLVPMDSLP